MFAICLVFLCVIALGCSSWTDDLRNGIDIGDSGVRFYLDKINQNPSLLERYSLRMGYSGIGLSLSKKPREDKLEFGLYYDEKEEGRGKKMGELIIPILIGLKATSLGVLMMAGVAALVLKSLMVAKLSLLISTALGLYKLFGHKGAHAPIASSYKPIVQYGGYYQGIPLNQDYVNQPASIGGYANYPTALHESADSSGQYAAVESTGINVTNQISQDIQQAMRRRQVSKRNKYSYNKPNRK